MQPVLGGCKLTSQKQSITALKEVLELAGSSLDQVVKFNIYLKDMADMVPMNDVFVSVRQVVVLGRRRGLIIDRQLLPEGPKPARTCIQAGKLPGGDSARIEIEAIAQV
jgi:enamine deaminase RidA (YjgF/YER057c/UK114 family)